MGDFCKLENGSSVLIHHGPNYHEKLTDKIQTTREVIAPVIKNAETLKN